MKEEIEVKLRAASPQAARATLDRLGAVLDHPRVFEDNVLYDDRAGSLRAAGCVLRLREVGGEALLTFKGPKRVLEGVKARDEHETRVASGDEMRAILAAAGYRPVFRYQKYRETWSYRGVEVVVDETPIGTFLELEGELAAIHEVASALGYTPNEYVSDSYAALFLAGGRTGDMVFG
ncbi:MAG TPA: class IV adenylate cyclase [Vicinamibacteria bacterium]|nr:class IV adenylate cyclase [Vicinamibacteria bacterium]